MDIYKSASDDYKEKANEEKIVLYGKEEQCHNPCGFVNDIYIDDRYTIDDILAEIGIFKILSNFARLLQLNYSRYLNQTLT